MRVKFSQTYKKNNFFIWGRLFSSSSLTIQTLDMNREGLVNLRQLLKNAGLHPPV